MTLSADERAQLAAELLDSIAGGELEADWAAEIQARALRARRDPQGGEPWESVEKRLRARVPG